MWFKPYLFVFSYLLVVCIASSPFRDSHWQDAQSRLQDATRELLSQVRNQRQQTHQVWNQFEQHQRFDDQSHSSRDQITAVLDDALPHTRNLGNRNDNPLVIVDIPAGNNHEDHSDDRIYPEENEDHDTPRFMNPFNFGQPSHGFNRGFTPFLSQFSARDEWWNGPNVCLEREETDEALNGSSPVSFSFHMSECVETETLYKCTTRLQAHGIKKTLIAMYQCCHGYARQNHHGACEKVEVKPMMNILREMGGTMFAELIEYTGLLDKFNNENMTVFCPTDEGLKSYREDYEENTIVVRPVKRRSLNNIDLIIAHAVPGFLKAGDFVDEEILLTEKKDTSVRTNVYNLPNKVMTVNCVKILSTNHFATNGVAHLMDGVLHPVMQSLHDLIKNEGQFTIFKKLLAQSGLERQLQTSGQLTLLAPTDDAFRQMDPLLLRKMLNGEACVEKIMKYHILPNVICMGILPSKARSITLLDADVRFRHDDDDKIFANDKEVIQRDQMATNGVMHVIDGVLIPEEAGSVTAVLDKWQLSDLIDLFESANMLPGLDEMRNITFFAPTNEAVKRASPLLNELRNSPGKLRDVLMYHVAHPTVSMCHMENNQQLSTSLTSKSLRFNHFYSMAFGMSHHATVQCAKLVEMDKKACGASVQMIEKVLFPPEGHLVDILSSNQSFSIIRKLLRDSTMERELIDHGPYTILAPTDQAFYSLPEEKLNDLMSNKGHIDEMLKSHILPEVLCCAGIQQTQWYYEQKVPTLNGNRLSLRRRHNSISVGQSRVVLCDIMADNGVVHAVDKVFLPRRHDKPTHIVVDESHFIHK